MDTKTAPEAARDLGVALSTMHAILDEAGVPRPGRGNARPVPPAVVDMARRRLGSVPDRAHGLTRSKMLLLAALARSPLGSPSSRALAAIAGVSPTTASRDLRDLETSGLVERTTRTVAGDRAEHHSFWRLAADDPTILRAVRKVTLPTLPADDDAPRLPRRLYRHFWNADPRRLSSDRDGSAIAGRLLGSDDVAAFDWALRHVSPALVDAALSRRGVAQATRRLVENWRADD